MTTLKEYFNSPESIEIMESIEDLYSSINTFLKSTPKPKEEKTSWDFFCEAKRNEIKDGKTLNEETLRTMWKSVEGDEFSEYNRLELNDNKRYKSQMKKYKNERNKKIEVITMMLKLKRDDSSTIRSIIQKAFSEDSNSESDVE